ncbi:MAG: cell wall-active antibiotics response protein [candidate division Zixibacteria bacterium]|nr:cell wall-active antibiotics response protein [candidate division Zixibacteria bacterium]
MTEKQDGKMSVNLIIGILIIVAGLIALLQNFDLDIPFNIWDFWPLILIAVGLSKLCRPKEYRNTFAATALVIIGVLFQLGTLDIIDFGFHELWPVLLILVGAIIIRQAFWKSGKHPSDDDYINITTILGGGEFNFTSKQLKGGSIAAIMGGSTVNLKEADTGEQTFTIETFALMGGIEIIVPQGWQVVMSGMPLLGGMENKTTSAQADTQDLTSRKLIVKGLAIMGGVEVKN